jgi:hypothetical protein
MSRLEGIVGTVFVFEPNFALKVYYLFLRFTMLLGVATQCCMRPIASLSDVHFLTCVAINAVATLRRPVHPRSKPLAI